MVDVLLAAGADPLVEDAEGRIAAAVAEEEGETAVGAVLRRAAEAAPGPRRRAAHLAEPDAAHLAKWNGGLSFDVVTGTSGAATLAAAPEERAAQGRARARRPPQGDEPAHVPVASFGSECAACGTRVLVGARQGGQFLCKACAAR